MIEVKTKESMDIFDSTGFDLHNGDTNTALDYMVTVFLRCLDIPNAFKGGYMLTKLLGGDSRATRDIDFSIQNKEAYESIKNVLEGIANKFLDVGIIDDYNVKETISETSSGGITFYSEGRLVLGIDIGLHDVMYGTQNYNLNVGNVKAFSVERMLSDKLLAILSRKRFRRTKDLYDFYIITSHFDVDYKELVNCIDRRENYDKSVWNNIPFSDTVLVEYLKAWKKLTVTSSLTGEEISKPSFSDCINRFNKFALLIKSGCPMNTWLADERVWV